MLSLSWICNIIMITGKNLKVKKNISGSIRRNRYADHVYRRICRFDVGPGCFGKTFAEAMNWTAAQEKR